MDDWTVEDFYAWCERRGVVLTDRQREGAVMILFGLKEVGSGRGAGKTFLLARIAEFIDG